MAFLKSKERLIRPAAALIAAALGTVALVGYHPHITPEQPKSPAAITSNVHKNIITTIFWVGETASKDNGKIPNSASAWDENWKAHFGGLDDPDNRNGSFPAGFTPKENPYYVALPYNDLDSQGRRKSTANYCRVLQEHPVDRYSYCKNIWVAITKDGKTVYAQVEDVGPFNENDPGYVFGTAAPANTEGVHAGLDVSPAVRDDMHLTGNDRTDWRFVTASEVPDGPWKQIVTTSPGDPL